MNAKLKASPFTLCILMSRYLPQNVISVPISRQHLFSNTMKRKS